MQIQLSVVGVGMHVHLVLLHFVSKVRRVENKKTRTQYRPLWHRAHNVNSLSLIGRDLYTQTSECHNLTQYCRLQGSPKTNLQVLVLVLGLQVLVLVLVLGA